MSIEVRQRLVKAGGLFKHGVSSGSVEQALHALQVCLLEKLSGWLKLTAALSIKMKRLIKTRQREHIRHICNVGSVDIKAMIES